MPYSEDLKYICKNVMVFICLVSLVGQVTLNFYERVIMQSELNYMKMNLYALKDTVNTIEKTYDKLYKEIKDITETEAYKIEPIDYEDKYQRIPVYVTTKVKDKKNQDETKILPFMCRKSIGKNATTRTRTPLILTTARVPPLQYSPENSLKYVKKCTYFQNF